MINTKIWEDNWFNQLDPIEKLFFIYLLTNPMTNISGVYELSKGTIGRSTGLETRVVNEIFDRFEKSGKVIYRDGWVVIANFIKHQNHNSPKIRTGIALELQNAPKELKQHINIPYGYGMDTISHSNSNSNLTKEAFANAQAPLKKTSVKNKTVKEFRDERRAKIGNPPFRTPRTEKQKETAEALKWIDYFKQQGQEQHGMLFMEVNDERRNKAVRKLVIRAYSVLGDLKGIIDWWFAGAGEWAAYEPENCFSTKMIERFKNSKKKNKDYIYINGNNS